MAWNFHDLKNPSSDEFLNNLGLQVAIQLPLQFLLTIDLSRQIAAFFLGWVFFYSVQIIISSPLLQEIFACAYSFFFFSTRGKHQPNDVEAHTHINLANILLHEDKTFKCNTAFIELPPPSRPRMQEGNALLVTLALCFACASVAHFASLLQYSTSGEIACGKQALVNTTYFL